MSATLEGAPAQPAPTELKPTVAPAPTSDRGTKDAAAPPTPEAEKVEVSTEKVKQLRFEVKQVGVASLNQRGQEAVDAYLEASKDFPQEKSQRAQHRESWEREHPGESALVHMDNLRNLDAETLAKEGSYKLNSADRKITFTDKTGAKRQITEITAVNGDKLTCEIAGSSETISVSRDDVINALLVSESQHILADGTPNKPAVIEDATQRGFVSLHLRSLQGEQILDSLDQPGTVALDKLITDTAKEMGLMTTDAARAHIDRIAPNTAGIQRTTENASQLDQWDSLRDRLEGLINGRNILDPNTFVEVFSATAPEQVTRLSQQIKQLQQAEGSVSGKDRHALRVRINELTLQRTMLEQLSTPEGRATMTGAIQEIQDGLVDPKNAQTAMQAALEGRIDDAVGALRPELRSDTSKDLQSGLTRKERFEKGKKIGKGSAYSIILALAAGGMLFKSALGEER